MFSASVPRIFITSSSRLPVRGLRASFLNSTSSRRSGEPAARQRFSQPSAGARISATRRRAGRRVGDPLEERVVSAGARPRRDAGVEAGRARGVGVHVGGDAQPLPPRLLHLRDGLVHLGPVGGARRLEVVDLGRHAGLARDGDQLVHRLQEPVALAAQVRDVAAAVGRRRLAQLDQLLGRGVGPGRVDQRGADARARPPPSPGGPARASSPAPPAWPCGPRGRRRARGASPPRCRRPRSWRRPSSRGRRGIRRASSR